MIEVTSFKWVPPIVRGLVRDVRVRWALEEAGLPYANKLIGNDDQDSTPYRLLQPFAQVPVFEEDGMVLFESGAIVLHIGARSEVLLPSDPTARSRAVMWVFAALNSLEPAIDPLVDIDFFYANEDWAKQRRPSAEARAKQRLKELADWLGERDFLEGQFTAGDLMMATVLQVLRDTDLVEREPKLARYLKRCEARSAFQRALEAHLNSFENQDRKETSR